MNQPITAEEARQLSQENYQKKIDDSVDNENVKKFLETMCYPEIMKSIQQGYFNAVVKLDYYDIDIVRGVIESLKRQGYSVSFEKEIEHLRAYLYINWRKK